MKCHCHPQPTGDMNALAGQLRKTSRRVTGPRKAVLELLRRHRHPMTIKEIHDSVSHESVDLATVYRSMHLLQEMALVKKFDFGDGVARYEMTEEGGRGHHHHLVCRRCFLIVEVETCFPSELESGIASKHGFSEVTHTLEFFGTCPRCRNLPDPRVIR